MQEKNAKAIQRGGLHPVWREGRNEGGNITIEHSFTKTKHLWWVLNKDACFKNEREKIGK